MTQEDLKKLQDECYQCGSDTTSMNAGLLAAYIQQRKLLLIVSVLLGVSVLGGSTGMVVLATKKNQETFLKNPLTGEVVQVDPGTLKQAPDRDEAEIKGFLVRWVRDAYSFNRGNVHDNTVYALRYVESEAQAEAKSALRLSERNEWCNQSLAGGIEYDPEKGRMPSAVINSWNPLQATVVFSRVCYLQDGTPVNQGPMALKAGLRIMPRSRAYPNGLMISSLTPTN